MHSSTLLPLALLTCLNCRYVTGLDDLDPANFVGGQGGSPSAGGAGGSGGDGGSGAGGTGAMGAGGSGAGGSGGMGRAPCDATAIFPTDFGGCARLENDEVHCWGYDVRTWGNCSTDFRRVPTPERVDHFTAAVVLENSNASCWLDGAGIVRCAGENTYCEANGLAGDACQPVVPTLPQAATAVSTNLSGSCAIVDGELHCWGDGTNIYGFPFGMSTCDPPMKHDALGTGVLDFGMGYDFRCYLLGQNASRAPGRILCEGENEERQLGLATDADQVGLVEALLPNETFTSVSAGDQFVLALTDTGEVYCWGGDTSSTYQRQCGGSTPNPVPSLVDLPGPAVEISGGLLHACAVLADRSLVCWGSDITGVNAGIARPVHPIELDGAPFKVPAGGARNRVAAGMTQTCALNEDGLVYCWGYNGFYTEDPEPPEFGILGTGSQEYFVVEPEPVLIACP